MAVQHGKDAYDGSLVDRMVDAAVSNRLSILATLTRHRPGRYTTKFSEGGDHPDSPSNQLPAIRQLMLANGDGAKEDLGH